MEIVAFDTLYALAIVMLGRVSLRIALMLAGDSFCMPCRLFFAACS